MKVLQHLLCKLAEEGNEVAQRALKTSYFGLDEIYNGRTNREMLHEELDHMMALIDMLNVDHDLSYEPNFQTIENKKLMVQTYLEYSQKLGLTEKEEVQLELPFEKEQEPIEEKDPDAPTVKIESALSQRGRDWQEFSAKVLNHIETYTVPQYGDAPNDLAETWTPRQSLDCVDRYSRRYGRNSRDGQQELDFVKMAHYIQLACLKHTKQEAAYAAG